IMTIIGLKELRQNASQIAERAQKGERFTVVKRSKPVFNISPIQTTSDTEEVEAWTRDLINKHRPAFKALSKK
ncbi:MAG: type II toxin-antitoxin system prevent-host-death family antitoxin, partial [Candidatus Saccharimonadales bacterium]